jgi:ribosomal protein RSM22 (predicted rRNA methylase)
MSLPEAIEQAIEREAGQVASRELADAAARLGRYYRAPELTQTRSFAAPTDSIAYLVTRMPAIFQVNQLVLGELARLRPDLEITSVLDLGCGPGTVTLAARQIFSSLRQATLIDRWAKWFDVGRRLISALDEKLGVAARFVKSDLETIDTLDAHDLVVISYALGELSPSGAKALIDRAWSGARSAIAIVEPGTPRGFSAIIAAREALIAAQGNIVAPCTHAHRCPIAGGDWCHFDTRIDRTSRHRKAKSGTLSYEIEKFSYLVAAKQPTATTSRAGRIIRLPLKRRGHVVLDLCTSEGAAKREVVSRRDKELYREARSARWGDLIAEKSDR